MQKNTIVLILCLSVLLTIFSNQSELFVDAQTNNTTLTTNWEDNFSNNPVYQECENRNSMETSTSSPFCISVIRVIYESPDLVVLESRYNDLIWQAVGEVKKQGYNIDDFEKYFDAPSGFADLTSPVLYTMVALSK